MEHHLPIFILTLLTATTLSSIYATTSSSCAATTFIKSTCNSTKNPDLCDKTCLPHATTIKCDLQRMSSYVLKAALVAAKNSSTTVSKISKEKGLRPSEKAAIKDCIEVVKDSVAQIKQSLSEVAALKNSSTDSDKKFKLSNVKTWMSAVLTDYQTCSDGLDEEDVRAFVENNITRSIQYSSLLSSNSLSIVNKIQ